MTEEENRIERQLIVSMLINCTSTAWTMSIVGLCYWKRLGSDNSWINQTEFTYLRMEKEVSTVRTHIRVVSIIVQEYSGECLQNTKF